MSSVCSIFFEHPLTTRPSETNTLAEAATRKNRVNCEADVVKYTFFPLLFAQPKARVLNLENEKPQQAWFLRRFYY
jgi:hypothetical protein